MAIIALRPGLRQVVSGPIHGPIGPDDATSAGEEMVNRGKGDEKTWGNAVYSDQAAAYGHGDGLSAITNVQFLEDIGEFPFDGSLAPVQSLGNLPVGRSFGH